MTHIALSAKQLDWSEHCSFETSMKHVIFVSGLAILSACRAEAPSEPEKPVEAAAKDAEQGHPPDPKLLQEAREAQKKLAGDLMSTLKQAVADGDFARGIEVCKRAAPSLSKKVGDNAELEIGRTSFKLRNPANAPRAWARPHVEARTTEPVIESGPGGELRMMSPIFMKEPCLKCHGQPGDIPEKVAEKLAALYPKDEAVGFKEGDLRGWFWVEVSAP